MKNIERLKVELNNKQYFSDDIYESILEENGLDAYDDYVKENRIDLLETVYTIIQMLANDIDNFRRVETEFVTTTAAEQYIEKRLASIRGEIDRLKDLEKEAENEYLSSGSVTGYLFFNSSRNCDSRIVFARHTVSFVYIGPYSSQ